MTNEEQRILSMMDISCEKTHGFNCPGCDTAISKIVAEAMRRGEEEAIEFCKEFIQSLEPVRDFDHRKYAQPVRMPSAKESFDDGQRYMIRRFIAEVSKLDDAELTSLKTT